MNTKIKLKLSLLNVSFLRKNKLTVWLENASNLSYEFFCNNFSKIFFEMLNTYFIFEEVKVLTKIKYSYQTEYQKLN